MNCSRQIEANAVTTAASAFLLAMVSAVLFDFQPSASNPTHTASTAPATAPHEKGFQPAGNSGNLNSTAHPLFSGAGGARGMIVRLFRRCVYYKAQINYTKRRIHSDSCGT